MAVTIAILDDEGDVVYELPEALIDRLMLGGDMVSMSDVAFTMRNKLMEADAKIQLAYTRGDDGTANVCAD